MGWRPPRARFAAFLCAALAFAARAGDALAAGLPEDMDALVAEGRKWFQESGNPDLGTAERNAARVKAWKCLWPAKEALDRYEEESPGDADRANARYGEIRMMVHWLKKEAPIGLLESSGVGPKKSDDDEEDPEPAKPLPPAPPTPTPSPPSPAPAPAPAPAPGGRPPSPEALFAAAEEYEKRHRFDVPGIQARYLRVVAACPDYSGDLARRAGAKAGELEAKLKDAYRLLRNEDPDSLKGIDNVRIKGMVIAVARDMLHPDPAVRETAARTIGLLANQEGVFALRQALGKEAEKAPADAMTEALVRIGGLKAADALADLKDDPRHAARGLDALVRLAKRNPVDRRIAAVQMARFVGVKEDELYDRMMATLQGLGPEGVAGLAACLDHGTTYPRLLKVVEALSGTKEAGVARVLSRYLQQGRGGEDAQVREAATNAIRRMAKKENVGEAVVPQLFYAVKVPATRWFTTQLLQELTGQKFTVKEWGSWSHWWLSTHPGWKDKP
jgi:HEAT repeat protein